MTRFPQGASAGQSPQWKASGRAVAPGPANLATSTSSSAKNQHPQQQQQQQQQQGRTEQLRQQQQQKALLSSNVHQTQFSFGLSGQTHLAGGSSNLPCTSAAAMATGSRQNSVFKNGSAGGNGSPRASTSSKSGPATASSLQPVLPVQQPTPAAKNSPSSSSSILKSPPPASNRNMSSILGHPHITPASTSSNTAKFQQHSQQKQSFHQPQHFFSTSYIQAAQYCQSNAGTSFASFYQQRLSERQSQQQNSLCASSSLTLATSSDPAKAAAAAAGGVKGLTPVSASAFPYIQTVSSPVSAKPPADQKAAAAPGNQC